MQLSESTVSILTELDTLSRHRLARRGDLGFLIELAYRNDRRDILDNLSFLAKFVSRTYRIMTRIGRDAEGYEVLEREFTQNLDNTKSLIQSLLESSPGDTRGHFETTYLTLTPEAFGGLLALLYDLSWYKNWQIDNRGTAG